jgi:hypothetical protein
MRSSKKFILTSSQPFRDYFGMTAPIITIKLALRKHMHLFKIDMYANAHTSVKADEQATGHSKMLNSTGLATSDI